MAKTGEDFPKVGPASSSISGLTVWTDQGFQCIDIDAYCDYILDKVPDDIKATGIDCTATGLRIKLSDGTFTPELSFADLEDKGVLGGSDLDISCDCGTATFDDGDGGATNLVSSVDSYKLFASAWLGEEINSSTPEGIYQALDTPCLNIPLSKTCTQGFWMAFEHNYILENGFSGRLGIHPVYSLDGGATWIRLTTGSIDEIQEGSPISQSAGYSHTDFGSESGMGTTNICIGLEIFDNSISSGNVSILTPTLEVFVNRLECC